MTPTPFPRRSPDDATAPPSPPLPALVISYDEPADWITAIRFGSIDDGVHPDRWEAISCRAGWLLDDTGGEPIGFRVEELATANIGPGGALGDDFAPFSAAQGPRFDVPSLGLLGATAGEILVRALAAVGGSSTLNRFYFNEAISAGSDEEALTLWGLCLQTGDLMAHYGLGITKYELGDLHGAYAHLRYYSRLAPHDAWTWCWRGRVALAIGEGREALLALNRARLIEESTGVTTDAGELLQQFEG